MSKIDLLLKDRLMSGLQRSGIALCSEYACKYRVMGTPFPGPWTFKHHPWLLGMHDSTAELNVGQKSAQAGFTELLLNWSFKKIDINKEAVLYILPTDANASDFSSARFDVALELSPYLSDLFSDVKNTQLKRAGSAVFYLRGSRARNKLISVPVPNVAIDEYEEMDQDNIATLRERMSGQVNKQMWVLSTPVASECGINALFISSDQRHFFFRCPHCNRLINLEFDQNIKLMTDDPTDIDGLDATLLFCHECKHELDHKTKDDWMRTDNSIWVPKERKNRGVAGWRVNQLYSRTVSPAELAKASIEARTDLATEQELYNQKFGLPKIVRGGRVEEEHLKAARGNHDSSIAHNFNHLYTMGIDVGTECHFEIDEWLPTGVGNPNNVSSMYAPRVVTAGTVRDFTDLDLLIIKHNVNSFVIDAGPERHLSKELCLRFLGLGGMCYYSDTQGKDLGITQDVDGVDIISADRTYWLDQSLGRFIKGPTITTPIDLPILYGVQLRKLIKVYKRDEDGQVKTRYISQGKDDHFGHSRNYAEIALKFYMQKGG